MIMSHSKHSIRFKTNETGFTLVELMIALVVSGLVMAAVVTVYVAQSRSYSERDDIANIQQDLRGALAIMPMEIRLAGFNMPEELLPNSEEPPEADEKKGPAVIVEATSTLFRFTIDTEGKDDEPNSADGNIGPNEDIAYGFAPGVAGVNGVVVIGGTASLGRHTGINALNLQPLADNVEALEFNYILDDGTATNGSGIATATQANLAIATAEDRKKIRAVQVSILARAANPAQGFLNTSTYTTVSGVVWNPTPDDNFRRRLVVTNIQLRNMGL
jgi:type IV pilus assembly protein PilW